MHITSKGQVTIPKEFRDALGLLPHTDVEFEIVDGILQLRKKETSVSRGKKILEHLIAAEKPSLSTDDIMRLTRGE